jgi:hypothetical protein
MDSNKFDEITRSLANGVSRRKMLKGLLAGAAGVVGLSRAATLEAASTCRNLGDACKSTASCCSGAGLFCQDVGATGAKRCECDTSAGFINCSGTCVKASVCCTAPEVACNGRCVDSTCPAGQSFNQGTCSCGCPTGTVSCQASDETTASCHSTTCTGGKVFDTTSCSCACPENTTDCSGVCVNNQCGTGQSFTCEGGCQCASGSVFCNGCCHDVTSACAGLHNKVFNADCCSCENPGQPSGRCKSAPLTCSA